MIFHFFTSFFFIEIYMDKSGVYDHLAQVGMFLLHRDNFIPYATLQALSYF
jgi:hypothetical protein